MLHRINGNYFYEELVYGENFVNDLQTKIQELSFENSDKPSQKRFMAMPKVNSLMWLEANNFKVNMSAYNKAASGALKIIEEIKKELDY